MPRQLSRLLLISAAGLMLASATVAHAQDDAQALSQKAQDLFGQEEFADAAQAYQDLTKLQPENGQAWFRLGYALHVTGLLDRAIAAHKKAATFNRFKGIASYNLGCAYALKGDTAKAFAALEQAVANGQSNQQQYVNDSDLKSLLEDPRFERLFETRNRPSDRRSPVHRQFDFWVGEWTVLGPNGNKVGDNKISKLENGYIIFEEWTGNGGSSGKSMNYFDPAEKKWKQVWVNGSGGVIYYTGEFKDGAMRFTGRYIKPDGTTEIARSSFTPLSGGRVQQFIEHSRDDGKTWYTYFNGTYIKQDAAKREKSTPSGE